MSRTGNLETDFKLFINLQKLFASGDLLLLAVSGGVDSVVLCHLCNQEGIHFQMAHANFQLRNEESNRDEQFVRSLAVKYNVPVHVKKFDTKKIAEQHKSSIQETARSERYRWFNEIIAAIHLDKPAKKYIVTAHHLDDNIETMMMHFFRGTGIHGLRGMLPRQGNIIRPLLPFRKIQLVNYAKDQNLEWVDDSSNLEDKYTRNYFRNRLLPAIREVYKDVDHNLAANLLRMQETETLFNEAIALHKKKIVEEKENEVYLLLEKLKLLSTARTFLHEIISPYGFSSAQTDDVLHLLNSETGRFVDSSTHRIFRNRARLVITPKETAAAAHIVIENMGAVNFPLGCLRIECVGKVNPVSTNASIALLDAKLIDFPLLLRRWKPGDYFYPLGMRKKKKIARFLIDLKLSKSEKEKVWVIEMDQKILWVVGFRIDERFKISEKTENVLQFELKTNT